LCLLRDVLSATGVPEKRRRPSAIAPPARKVQPRPDENAFSQTVGSAVDNGYIAAKNPWLQSQFHTPFGLGDLPFVVGRRPLAGEEQPPCQPDLKLDDTVPFWLSRNHFIIEKRDGCYHVRDLNSTLGTIVNGEPIGDHFRAKDAVLRAGDNEVIAGGLDSPFVFSVFIGWRDPRQWLASIPTRCRPGRQPHSLTRGRA
jgi:hypothetical protein